MYRLSSASLPFTPEIRARTGKYLIVLCFFVCRLEKGHFVVLIRHAGLWCTWGVLHRDVPSLFRGIVTAPKVFWFFSFWNNVICYLHWTLFSAFARPLWKAYFNYWLYKTQGLALNTDTGPISCCLMCNHASLKSEFPALPVQSGRASFTADQMEPGDRLAYSQRPNGFVYLMRDFFSSLMNGFQPEASLEPSLYGCVGKRTCTSLPPSLSPWRQRLLRTGTGAGPRR